MNSILAFYIGGVIASALIMTVAWHRPGSDLPESVSKDPTVMRITLASIVFAWFFTLPVVLVMWMGIGSSTKE